jgi:hypothetical protein
MYRLRIFAKMVLIVLFGTNKNEITGSWRKLPYEVLHNLHSRPNIVKANKSN